MAEFDPKAYLAKKKTEESSFDPSKYLSSKKIESVPKGAFEVSPRGLLKGTLQALPIAGSIAGGAALGLPTGGAGAPIGAGLGAAAGYSAKKLGEKYLLGEEMPSREEYYPELLKETTAGAASELGGQVIGKGLEKGAEAISNIPKALEKKGYQKFAAATGMFKNQAKKLLKLDPKGMEGNTIEQIGKHAHDTGIVQAGDNIEDIAQKSGERLNQVGERIGNAYKQAEESAENAAKYMQLNAEEARKLHQTGFNKNSMLREFLDKSEKLFKGKAGGAEAVNKTKAILNDFEAIPKDKLSIQDVQKFKTEVDDILFAANKNPAEIPANKEALKEFRDYLKDKIDQRLEFLDSLTKGNKSESLKALNKDYSMTSQINKMARDRLSSDLGNNFLSITDKGAMMAGGAAGFMSGDTMEERLKRGAIGLAAGPISKVARTYGRPLMGSAELGASKIAAPIAKVAAPTTRMISAPVEISSPQVLNSMIQNGQIPIAVVRKLGGSQKAYQFFQTPAGKIMLQKNLQPKEGNQ